MSNPEKTEVDQAIAKVQGTPKNSDEMSRRDLLNFEALVQIIGKKIGDAGLLVEEYARAKVAQETNTASKTAAEAAELASRSEENEAKANKTRQEAVGGFVENLKSIADLEPATQMLAIAKLMIDNPELSEQLDRVESLVTQLRMRNGTQIASLGIKTQESLDE